MPSDWATLEPLPLKRQRVLDREHLAAVSHSRKAARHKGRCHLSNQKRRQAAKERREAAAKTAAKSAARYGRYIDRVRAYWRGETDEHPGLPA